MSSATGRDAGASFRFLARILRIGTVVAVALVAIGFAWAVLAGTPGPTDRSVLELVGEGGPDAFIGLGLIGLALVPIIALGSALTAFARAGERRAMLASASVLVLVLASLAAALAIGAP